MVLRQAHLLARHFVLGQLDLGEIALAQGALELIIADALQGHVGVRVGSGSTRARFRCAGLRHIDADAARIFATAVKLEAAGD